MVKVNANKFGKMVKDNDREIDDGKLKLDDIKTGLGKFIYDQHFQGQAAMSTQRYLMDGPEAVSLSLQEILKTLSEDLNQTLKSFKAVDDADDAIIGTKRITELQDFTKGTTDAASTALNKVNRGIDSANTVSGVHISSINLKSFKEAALNLEKELKITENDIRKWDREHKDDMAHNAKLVSLVDDMISTMSQQHKLGGVTSYNYLDATGSKLRALNTKFDDEVKLDAFLKLAEKAKGGIDKLTDSETYRFVSLAAEFSNSKKLLDAVSKREGGAKAYRQLLIGWKQLSKTLGGADSPALKKLATLMGRSPDAMMKNLKKTAGFNKTYKIFGKNINPGKLSHAFPGLTKGLSKVKNGLSWLTDPLGSAKGWLSSRSGKYLKSLGKYSKGAGWIVGGAFATINGIEAYNDPKSPAYHDVGKAAVHVGVDYVKNAGPVDGLMVGAKFGPVGAVIGTGVGTVNYVWKKLFPKSHDVVFGAVEKGADKLVDVAKDAGKKVAKSVEKAGQKAIKVAEDVGKGIGNAAKKIGDGIRKAFPIKMPKLW